MKKKTKRIIACGLALLCIGALLAGCRAYNTTREVPVDFIPWQDGQQITYRSDDLNEARKIYTFKHDTDNALWIIDTALYAGEDELSAHTELREADLMAVRSSLTLKSTQADANWSISGEYLIEGEPWMEVVTTDGAETETFESVPEHLYEFETFFMAMRTFPLTEDFEAPINLVLLTQSGLGGAYVNGNGIVAIDGEPCYHLYLSTERGVPVDHESVFAQAWISIGQNRSLIQFTSGQAIFKLEE